MPFNVANLVTVGGDSDAESSRLQVAPFHVRTSPRE
jgi:hypothetical protein